MALGQEVAVGELVEEELIVRRQDSDLVVINISIIDSTADATTGMAAVVLVFVLLVAGSLSELRFG